MSSFGTLVKPVRGRLLAGAALSLAGSACGALPFVAVAEIARQLLGATPDSAAVWRWVAIGASGALLRLVLFVAAGLLTHHADADLQRRLRAALAHRAALVPLGWLLGRGSADLKKGLNDDIEDTHHLVAHALNDVASAIGLLLAVTGYLVVIDWRMTLVTLAPIPLAMAVIARAHRGVPARMAALTSAQRQINSATIEYVDGIEVIKNYGREGYASHRFSEAVDALATSLREWSAESARGIFVSRLLMSPPLFLLVILGGGVALVAADWLAPLDLLPFVLLGVSLPSPYATIVQGTLHLRRARMAAAHIEQLLDAPVLPEPADPVRPRGHDVEFDHVSFSYGDGGDDDDGARVLTDVTASCRAGTLTALVGPSGSGKTTLTRLVPRFFDVTAGAVRVGGTDVRSIATEQLLGIVAMVFQDVVLLRDTVRDNIRLARPQAGDDEVQAAAKAARIHDVITTMPRGYDTVLGEDGAGLSGGERQRLTVARALLQDAPIVILDEATAFADPENEVAVQEALSELAAGRTVLVIAHRLHTIVHADQILVLDGGRIVERGRHDDLLARGGRYARMWRAQEAAPQTAQRGPA